MCLPVTDHLIRILAPAKLWCCASSLSTRNLQSSETNRLIFDEIIYEGLTNTYGSHVKAYINCNQKVWLISFPRIKSIVINWLLLVQQIEQNSPASEERQESQAQSLCEKLKLIGRTDLSPGLVIEEKMSVKASHIPSTIYSASIYLRYCQKSSRPT